MSRQMGLSGAAITVLLLATAPAGAVSLNLGGDGLVSIGGSGSSGSSTDASVSIGTGGVLDGGSDGSIGLDLFGNADGGTGDTSVGLDLFGNAGGGANGNTGVDVNLLGTGGGVLGGDNVDAVVTLFGSTGDGKSNGDVKANLLGGGSGGSDDVVLSLFGAGGGTGSVIGGSTEGGQQSATMRLFGAGGSSSDGGDGQISTSQMRTGSVSEAGVMNDGTGAQPMPGQIQTRAGVQVAANAAAAGNSNAKCFAPDETQIANLLGRTSYSASVTASWQSASSVSLVPIDLCPNAKARLAAALNANANINYMQNAVATNARIKSKLQPGYDPKDVLAVDKSGDDLTVYVY